ncbi:histidine kinase [Smaragdicoccus niigatensis]|uniref:HAMP domain-containing sensor histidine kinase n=1 Tax=Smaragdicoccus niigatensis TaxID=359359 RepID=UPI00036CA394|nr:histidine kinase [Smaragdicoccus niigatensis]
MSAEPRLSLPERIYRRIGWWMVVSYAVLAWTAGAVVMCALIWIFARIYPLSFAQAAKLAGLFGVMWLICVAASFIHGVVAALPLRRFERGEAEAAEAWTAVVRIPMRALKFNFGAGLLIIYPSSIFCVAQVVPLSAPLIGLVLLGTAGNFLYSLTTSSFLAAVFIRPALRSISSELRGATSPESGLRLFDKTVYVLPALGLSMAMFGCGLSLDSRVDMGTAFTRLVVATVVATVATVPVTMLFANSVNIPIEEFLLGTKRVKAGDYSKRVPELSGDEFGELARSFNDAMAGLSERQQLAREVRASRARIVAAADESRKRIERNLHDGAQQRLVALALDLKLLEETATGDMADALHQAGESVKEALTELRELARGLHPQILTSDGLGPALSQLASRAKVPVRVDAPEQRYPEPVETAAYFVVAEALANVSKYAKAGSAVVVVESHNGTLQVEVADDGIGGASLGAGTGLAGLADRVAALEGRLTVDSPPGAGTRVRAEIPVRRDS